jgi:hypothetical protein
MSEHLAVPRPIVDKPAENRIVGELSAALDKQFADDAVSARVAAIEKDAGETRAARDGSSAVTFSADALALLAEMKSQRKGV